MSAGYTSNYKLVKGKFATQLTHSDRTFTPLAFGDLKKLKVQEHHGAGGSGLGADAAADAYVAMTSQQRKHMMRSDML